MRICLLSGMVVLVAAPRSGSLSTATHAMEQNREVFAVPRSVDSLASRGCHRMIRDGPLAETVDYILREPGPLVLAARTARDEPLARLPTSLPSAARNDPSWASSRATQRGRVLPLHFPHRPLRLGSCLSRVGPTTPTRKEARRCVGRSDCAREAWERRMRCR